MSILFNPNASFLHLTDRFTLKEKREIKRRKKSLRNLDGLFGSENKNFQEHQPFPYESAEVILEREGSETLTLFFWFQSSDGELVVYGPAANHREIEKAYQYTHDIIEQKIRRRQWWRKAWGVTGKVVMIAALISTFIAIILLYLALTRK